MRAYVIQPNLCCLFTLYGISIPMNSLWLEFELDLPVAFFRANKRHTKQMSMWIWMYLLLYNYIYIYFKYNSKFYIFWI